MYIREVHAETSLKALRQLIRENPLGLLTTGIKSATYPFLQSSHIPFVLDVADEDSETETGRLRGHLARANPHSKAMMETLTAKPQPGHVLEDEVLVIFNAAAHHYVTPKFYTETKPASGKVVPTWNYAAAQVYGRARIYFDTGADDTSAFLHKQIRDLSHHNETTAMGYTGEDGRPTEWKVDDAPEKYIDLLKKAIIGIEIDIDRLEGKFKMSQEMGKGDRDGIVAGFSKMGSEAAQGVARLVQERGERKEAEKEK